MRLSCLFTILTIAITTTQAATVNLSDYGLCEIPGDSSDCAFACHEMYQARGNCILNKCYCTEKSEVGHCEYDNHEICDSLCQEMSPDLIGFCMDDQCNCLA
ncbi:hypothetical protein BDB01DRAFT_835993 [Pilobolus umbonatus]|nr:hypothetical protein BDB01DRAFT_835993 [Pilobolus umbonatus]